MVCLEYVVENVTIFLCFFLAEKSRDGYEIGRLLSHFLIQHIVT